MAKDGGESGANGKPFALLRTGIGPKPMIHEPRDENDRDPAFERVAEENADSRRRAQGAEDIGCADVAAADFADVDPFRLGDQEAGGNGTQQIRRHQSNDVSPDSHEGHCMGKVESSKLKVESSRQSVVSSQ